MSYVQDMKKPRLESLIRVASVNFVIIGIGEALSIVVRKGVGAREGDGAAVVKVY